MSSRRRADQLAEAIRSRFAEGPAPAPAHTKPALSNVVRTTFSAPSAVILQLRQLALLDRCTMNDLILIGVQDLLKSIGRDSEIAVSPAVRERIEARRRPARSDAGEDKSEMPPDQSHK